MLTVLLVVLLGGLGTKDPEGPTYHHYVAMGDSFTAAPYVPLNDVAYGCNRSSNNYPHLVARALHIDDLKDRSCTGAQTVDLYGRGQRTADGQSVAPQFTALSARTDLVTVGIGANNGRLYARMATVCRKMRKICPLYDERDTLGAIVDALRPELVSTLDQVKERAPRRPGAADQLPQAAAPARRLPAAAPVPAPGPGHLPRHEPAAALRDARLRRRRPGSSSSTSTRPRSGTTCAPGTRGCRAASAAATAAPRCTRSPSGQAALARLVEHTLSTEPPQDRRGLLSRTDAQPRSEMGIADGPIIQIAWVVDDIAATEELSATSSGSGRGPASPTCGSDRRTAPCTAQPADFTVHVSLGYAAKGTSDLQLELIQPVSGESIYTEFLAVSPPGLHHVCFEVDDIDAACAAAEAEGHPVVQRGSMMAGAMDFAYVDGSSAGAPYIELARIGTAMRDVLRRSEAAFQGGHRMSPPTVLVTGAGPGSLGEATAQLLREQSSGS